MQICCEKTNNFNTKISNVYLSYFSNLLYFTINFVINFVIYFVIYLVYIIKN